MDSGFALWLFAVSLGASAVGGMLGMASGIFIVPILTLFGHLDIHTAIGASIVSVIACSCGSAAPFLKRQADEHPPSRRARNRNHTRGIDRRSSGRRDTCSLPFFLFAVILLVSAQQMLARRGDPAAGSAVADTWQWAKALRLDSSHPDRLVGREIAYRVQRVPMGMTLMYGAGLISALLGIGSGVLKIPAMDTALRLPIKVSSATSNFMIGVTAAASAGAYFMRGDIVPAIAGPVALGSVVGAVLGARILMVVSNDRLRLLFVLVLTLLGLQMLLDAFSIKLLRVRYERYRLAIRQANLMLRWSGCWRACCNTGAGWHRRPSSPGWRWP